MSLEYVLLVEWGLLLKSFYGIQQIIKVCMQMKRKVDNIKIIFETLKKSNDYIIYFDHDTKMYLTFILKLSILYLFPYAFKNTTNCKYLILRKPSTTFKEPFINLFFSSKYILNRQ